MDDSFFGFNTEIPSLGSGKYDSLEPELTGGELEEEYDALNDETFGIEVNAEDDWEDDHEKLAELEKANTLQEPKSETCADPRSAEKKLSSGNVGDEKLRFEKNDNYLSNKDSNPFPRFSNPDEELEHSITQLVLEDELDDPAIMNVSKSKPFSVNSLFNCKSPPPPAILESNHVGSPSTSSIWTSPQGVENFTSEQRFGRLFNNANIKNDPKLEDPCIIGIGKDIRKKSLPPDIMYKAKTVDEIEREHLNMSPSPVASHQFEKEIPFHPHSVTFNEMLSEVKDRRRHSSPRIISTKSSGSSPKPDADETNKNEYFLSTSPIHSLANNKKSPHIPFGLDVARSLNASQPFVGAPLRFPRGFSHMNQLPSTGLMPFSQPQTRFLLQLPYFDNAYRRMQPSHLRPNLPLQNQQRPRMQQQQMENQMFRSRLPPPKDENEYNNLMTQKEKEWLIKIQMMQLQTTNPYLDDYYFTTYMMKKKNEEQKKGGGDHKEEPKLVVPEMAKIETKTYKPAQYEGSLGKLQAVSVNFPRKIIDVDIVHPEDGDGEPCIGNKELRRFRQILLEIEKLYSVFLTVDDLEKKMGALPKESHEPLEESKRTAINSVYNSLSTAITLEDKFVQIMTIRKGRNLVWRSLSLFNKEKQFLILKAILNNWTFIMKRINQEEAYQKFANYYQEIIEEAKLDNLVEIGKAIHHLPDSILLLETNGTHKSQLPSMLQTKLGMFILCSLIERAEILRKLNNQEFEENLQDQWFVIVEHITDVWGNISDLVLAKMPKVFPKVMDHFLYCIQDKNKLAILQKKLNVINSDDSDRKQGEGDAS